MKTYIRNARFWEQARFCFLGRAQLWSKGSESRAMIELAHSEDWDQFARDNAPASRKTSPQDLAVLLLNRFLS